MNLKALGVLILSLFFLFFATKCYNSENEGLCCQEETKTVAPAPLPAEKAKDPLMFKWNSPTTITYDKFPGFKSSILAGNKDGQILQLTGKYFEGEVAPTGSGHADMGIARANAIWKERFSEIPKERIEFLSEKVAMRDGVKTEEFTNAGFKWISAAPAKVEKLRDGIIVRFPYNATQKTIDPQIDKGLREIAEQLKKNPNQKVTITGHTDSNGEDAANMRLSDRRAKTVRDILVSYGVKRNKITTIPKGETTHVASNDTQRGKAANRRAEVRITQ